MCLCTTEKHTNMHLCKHYFTNFLSDVFVNFLQSMVVKVGWPGKGPQEALGESNFCTYTLLNQGTSNCWLAEATNS